jgi:hypothetical protein
VVVTSSLVTIVRDDGNSVPVAVGGAVLPATQPDAFWRLTGSGDNRTALLTNLHGDTIRSLAVPAGVRVVAASRNGLAVTSSAGTSLLQLDSGAATQGIAKGLVGTASGSFVALTRCDAKLACRSVLHDLRDGAERSMPGDLATAAFVASPDGTSVATFARGADGRNDLAIIELPSTKTTVVSGAGADALDQPGAIAWSNDAKNIAVITGDRLTVVSRSGARLLAVPFESLTPIRVATA